MADITGTSQITAPVNVVAQRKLLSVAKQRCVYFVGTMPGTIARHSGSFTISWRRINALTPTTSALSQDTGTVAYPIRAGTQAGTTNLSTTVSKYGQHLVLNEEVDLLNYTSHTSGLMETLGISAGRSLNMLQRNEEEDNSTARLGSAATAAAAIIASVTRPDIINVVNTLNRNSAMKFTPRTTGSGNFNTTPIRDSYWGLCHVDVEEDIRDLAGFQPRETYDGQTQTHPYEFGMVRGTRFISSEDSTIDAEAGATGAAAAGLRTSGNDTVDIYNTVIFGREAFGSVGLDSSHIKESYAAGDSLPAVQIIRKEFGSAGAADPFNEISTLAWKSWHGAKVLNTAWSRCLRTGSKAR